MGFYLHLIDDRHVERAPAESLFDRDELVSFVTTFSLVVAAVALLWQQGVVQFVWTALTGA